MTIRILVVEDHPTMRGAMRLVLEGEGFDISEAADGDAALESIERERPDLVFLDLNIPGTSGPDVLTAIRGEPATSSVRVIVVTATGEEGRADALALGADGYFTKPFSPAALLETVARVLDGPPAAGGA